MTREKVDGDDVFRVWRSDGTPQLTRALVGIEAGQPPLLSVGEGCAFVGTQYSPLWFTDGTEGGTRQVLRLESPFGSIATFGCRAWFGYQGAIWTSDGTSAGTSLVRRFSDAAWWDVRIGGIVRLGGAVLFVVSRFGAGDELWRTDGTSPGTVKIRSFAYPDYVYGLASGDDAVFFLASGKEGRGLWRSDGTANGTTLLRPYPVDAFHPLAFSAGKLFVGGSHESLVSDGTAAGTVSLDPALGADFAATEGRAFFRNGSDGEPWVTDGTVAGTRRIADLLPGYTSSSPSGFAAFGSRVLFRAALPGGSSGPWVTDGSEAGTLPLLSSWTTTWGSDVRHFTEVAGSTYFLTSDAGLMLTVPSYLWSTAGAAGSSTLLTSDPVGWNYPWIYSPPWPLGRRAVFATNSQGLLASDGTLSGTTWLGGAPVRNVIPLDGLLLFRKSEGSGAGLWRTDGTPKGTFLFRPGGAVPLVGVTTRGRRRAFFYEPGAENEGELWETDATAAGTRLVASIGNAPGDAWALGAKVLWTASSASGTWGIWASDGTAQGTLALGAGGSRVLKPCESVAYFVREAEPSGLWVTDGTSSGTGRVATLTKGRIDPAKSACLGNRLVFVHTSGTDSGLWVYDPVVRRVTKLVGASSYGFEDLTTVGSRVFFRRLGEGAPGTELWSTDGSVAGTRLVKDIAPGLASSIPDVLLAAHGRVWFTANDLEHGRELWVSDGTPDGTARLTDVYPATGSSFPDPSDEKPAAGLAPDGLYFAAYAPSSGTEPWVLPLPTAFHTLPPCRLLDTRSIGLALGAGEIHEFPGTGACGVPETARRLSVNLTVAQATGSGHVATAADRYRLTGATAISFAAGQVRANSAILPLGTQGTFALHAALEEGAVHVIVDVNGYFE